MTRMYKLEKEKGTLTYEDIVLNIESSLKAAFYTHFRMLMNYKKNLVLVMSFQRRYIFY